jgi:hypothetical protein
VLKIKVNGATTRLLARPGTDGVWDLRCLDPLVGEFILDSRDTLHLWSDEFGYWLLAKESDLRR